MGIRWRGYHQDMIQVNVFHEWLLALHLFLTHEGLGAVFLLYSSLSLFLLTQSKIRPHIAIPNIIKKWISLVAMVFFSEEIYYVPPLSEPTCYKAPLGQERWVSESIVIFSSSSEALGSRSRLSMLRWVPVYSGLNVHNVLFRSIRNFLECCWHQGQMGIPATKELSLKYISFLEMFFLIWQSHQDWDKL